MSDFMNMVTRVRSDFRDHVENTESNKQNNDILVVEVVRRLMRMKQLSWSNAWHKPEDGAFNKYMMFPARLFGKTWVGLQALGSALVSSNSIALNFRPEDVRSALYRELIDTDDPSDVDRHFRPLVVTADAMTPATQQLYATCEYALDINGVPCRRITEDKNSPIPAGCEITLLMSYKQLMQFIWEEGVEATPTQSSHQHSDTSDDYTVEDLEEEETASD